MATKILKRMKFIITGYYAIPNNLISVGLVYSFKRCNSTGLYDAMRNLCRRLGIDSSLKYYVYDVPDLVQFLRNIHAFSIYIFICIYI